MNTPFLKQIGSGIYGTAAKLGIGSAATWAALDGFGFTEFIRSECARTPLAAYMNDLRIRREVEANGRCKPEKQQYKKKDQDDSDSSGAGGNDSFKGGGGGRTVRAQTSTNSSTASSSSSNMSGGSSSGTTQQNLNNSSNSADINLNISGGIQQKLVTQVRLDKSKFINRQRFIDENGGLDYTKWVGNNDTNKVVQTNGLEDSIDLNKVGVHFNDRRGKIVNKELYLNNSLDKKNSASHDNITWQQDSVLVDWFSKVNGPGIATITTVLTGSLWEKFMSPLFFISILFFMSSWAIYLFILKRTFPDICNKLYIWMLFMGSMNFLFNLSFGLGKGDRFIWVLILVILVFIYERFKLIVFPFFGILLTNIYLVKFWLQGVVLNGCTFFIVEDLKEKNIGEITQPIFSKWGDWFINLILDILGENEPALVFMVVFMFIVWFILTCYELFKFPVIVEFIKEKNTYYFLSRKKVPFQFYLRLLGVYTISLWIFYLELFYVGGIPTPVFTAALVLKMVVLTMVCGQAVAHLFYRIILHIKSLIKLG